MDTRLDESDTMLDAVSPTPENLIAAAHDLIPRLRERASECERMGRIPEETVQELHERRLFDVTKPKRYGGLEMGWDVARTRAGRSFLELT